MKEYKQHEFGKILPPMTDEEFQSLCDSIKSKGLYRPILLYQDQVLDGWHRYSACKKLNVEPKYSEFKGDDNEALEEVQVSIEHRNLTKSQLGIVAGKFAIEASKIIAKKEELRKLKSVESDSETFFGVVVPSLDISYENLKPTDQKLFDSGSCGEARVIAAKKYGVNTSYVQKGKKLLENDPELADAVFRGEKTFQDIEKEEKLAKREKQLEEIKQKIQTENLTIKDKFDVLVIDPPWPYDRAYDPEVSRVANPYPEMSLKEIQAIELPLKDNAVVFLWTTHQFLPYSYSLLDGWNLKYKATMVWDKEKMGMGANIRMQCEFCIIAFKGSPKVLGSGERDIIREARREHSRKPDAFYKFVERYTIGSRLDYFSREDREGWQCYGAETSKFSKDGAE
jgi:N6-adenosine-specific RNA methylase IME4